MTELLLIAIIIAQVIIVIVLLTQKSQVKKVMEAENIKDFERNVSINRDLIDRIDTRFNDVLDRNTNFERITSQNLNTFNTQIVQKLSEHFVLQQKTIESRLDKIDLKVNESLNEGFKKTHSTFTNIVERLTKIDEAQKKIDNLSKDIVSLQDVLTDKSSRGAFGEVQLNQILSSVFGDKNDKVYQTQYTFKNGKRSDAVLFAPEPLGTVAIDSKFPLENYRKLIKLSLGSLEYLEVKKRFESDIKKHIDDIATRYIIENETSDQAILFVPAEAVFAQINAYHQDILSYAQSRRVWLTSPTTLMSTLTIIQTILMNMERDKYTHEIQLELKKLDTEFRRYRDRWNSLSKRLEQVGSDVKDIHITTDKITKRFESIQSVEYKEID